MEVNFRILQKRRKKHGLAMADIARSSGKDLSVVSRMERGERSLDQVNRTIKYLEAYGYKLIDIWKEEEC